MLPSIPRITPAFVKAVLRTMTELPSGVCLAVHEDDMHVECLASRAVEELEQEDEQKLHASLRHLHVNLGHPTNAQMLRILRHGGAHDVQRSWKA